MSSMFRRFLWWVRGSRKEAELREELEFHLEQEARERREAGLAEEEALWAARRDLGNEARLKDDIRSIWTWRPLDELSQDLRFAFRTLFKHRAVAVFAIISLALGIGANTAIYSFMDALLLRSLPVGDPDSLVVMTWRSKHVTRPKPGEPSAFVMHSGDGSTFATSTGQEARIFPLPAFERLRDVAAPVLSTIFVRFPAGTLTVQVDGESELTNAEFVSGDFFRGIALSPGAGRLLLPGQQHSVHRRRRDGRGIRRDRAGHHGRTLSTAADQSRSRPRGRATAQRSELVLGGDHGPPARPRHA